MNLTGLHILLTHRCNRACDHCFVWGSPEQAAIFSHAQLEYVFEQALDVDTIRMIFFEGGEPFLERALLTRAVARAHALGFSTGIVSNGYWAVSTERAYAALHPLAEAGLDMLQVSSDELHGDELARTESHPALEAGNMLGLAVSLITTNISEDVLYRGRAAVRLAEGVPRRTWTSFTTCPYENLANPGRVHLDPLGNLHLCQGLVMGNLFEKPLKQIVDEYDPETLPVVSELLAGGPTRLALRYLHEHKAGYVDACHLCYSARNALRERFPSVLRPGQMYGDEDRESKVEDRKNLDREWMIRELENG